MYNVRLNLLDDYILAFSTQRLENLWKFKITLNRFMFHLETYGCCVSVIFMEFVTFIDPPALRLRLARFPQTLTENYLMKLVIRVLKSDHLVPSPVANPANLVHEQITIETVFFLQCLLSSYGWMQRHIWIVWINSLAHRLLHKLTVTGCYISSSVVTLAHRLNVNEYFLPP